MKYLQIVLTQKTGNIVLLLKHWLILPDLFMGVHFLNEVNARAVQRASLHCPWPSLSFRSTASKRGPEDVGYITRISALDLHKDSVCVCECVLVVKEC